MNQSQDDATTPTCEPLTLDVRPDIRAGHEPFQRIMEAVSQLNPGQDLIIVNDFEPVPLYQVLEARGYAHQTTRLADGGWQVTFHDRLTSITNNS